MEPKKQKILTAAYRLLNQHGFRKVTMSDIAEAAEMSRPSLYAVFDNKEAVFNAIGTEHNARCEVASWPEASHNFCAKPATSGMRWLGAARVAASVRAAAADA